MTDHDRGVFEHSLTMVHNAAKYILRHVSSDADAVPVLADLDCVISRLNALLRDKSS